MQLQLVRELTRMQRSRTPERDERQSARIMSTLDRNNANRAHHLGVDGLDDSLGVEIAERTLGSGPVQAHPAGEGLRKPPEGEVRVSDRRTRAAAPVTRRPRICSGALRPDAQSSALVTPRDRAAPRADRLEVDTRKPNGKTRDTALCGTLDLAVSDQRHVCRRAAHVQSDRFAD